MSWWLKLGAKVALSQLGISYHAWRRLGIFRHGQMDSMDYAQKIFDLHVGRAFADKRLDGKVVVEIGPGDSLASAIMAKASGAMSTILIDAGSYATREVTFYRDFAIALLPSKPETPDLTGATTLEEVLQQCSATYHTTGVSALSTLATQSVDLIWSHSVLEHIPLRQLPELLSEMHRVLKPTGWISHNIDFQDHLEHGLNSLRFSEEAWESPLMRNAGFYTNRVRALNFHRMIHEAGFEIVNEEFGRWPTLPIKRKQLDYAFSDLTDDELLIRTSHLLARTIR